jgi:hypothetical protein
MLSVIILSVFMLNVIMLNAIMLSVVAPLKLVKMTEYLAKKHRFGFFCGQ